MSHIRRASFEDAAQLAILMEQLTGNRVTESDMVNRLDYVSKTFLEELYVYDEDGKILGILGFRIREAIEEVNRYGEVSVLVTDESHHHLGIGRSLIDFAEKHAQEAGCTGTWLISGLGREEQAHSFYRKMGYQVTGYLFEKVKPSEN
jgi:GNAT superfamily N-acetyltransferase